MDSKDTEDKQILSLASPDEMKNGAISTNTSPADCDRHGSLTIATTCVFIVGIMAGSGFLALPKSVDNSGVIGIALLLLFCLLSIYTATILGKCWTTMLDRGLLPPSGHVRYPYPAIGEAAYGKMGRRMVTVAINITNFGTVVVYILLASENVHSLLAAYTSFSMCYICPIITAIVLPVTWFGTPKDFWGTALGATMATLTASLLVLVSILKDEHKYTVVQHETVDIVSFFTAFGTMAFSYGGHPVFPTVQADMKRPKNFGTACMIGYSILLLIYMPASVASYFIYGKHVSPNVLNTLESGPLRTIATILMTLHLFLGIIIIINPVCQEVEQVANIEATKFTWKRAVARTLVLAGALFIAETIPHFSAILALIGGSTVTLLAYIYPPLFLLKLASKEPEPGMNTWEKMYVPLHIKVINIEVMLVGFVAGIAATYSAINDLANSAFSQPCYVNPRNTNV